MEKTAVILAVPEGGSLPDRSVRSVLEQSCPEFQLILVGPRETVSPWESADSCIRLLNREEKSLESLWNQGAELALQNPENRWLTFLSSRDWLHRDFLKLLQPPRGVLLSLCRRQQVRQFWPDSPAEPGRQMVLKAESVYVQYYGDMESPGGKLISSDLWQSGEPFWRQLLRADRAAVREQALFYGFPEEPDSLKVRSSMHLGCLQAFSRAGWHRAYGLELRNTAWLLYDLARQEKDPEESRSCCCQLRKILREQIRLNLFSVNRQTRRLLLPASVPGLWRLLGKPGKPGEF